MVHSVLSGEHFFLIHFFSIFFCFCVFRFYGVFRCFVSRRCAHRTGNSSIISCATDFMFRLRCSWRRVRLIFVGGSNKADSNICVRPSTFGSILSYLPLHSMNVLARATNKTKRQKIKWQTTHFQRKFLSLAANRTFGCSLRAHTRSSFAVRWSPKNACTFDDASNIVYVSTVIRCGRRRFTFNKFLFLFYFLFFCRLPSARLARHVHSKNENIFFSVFFSFGSILCRLFAHFSFCSVRNISFFAACMRTGRKFLLFWMQFIRRVIVRIWIQLRRLYRVDSIETLENEKTRKRRSRETTATTANGTKQKE